MGDSLVSLAPGGRAIAASASSGSVRRLGGCVIEARAAEPERRFAGAFPADRVEVERDAKHRLVGCRARQDLAPRVGDERSAAEAVAGEVASDGEQLVVLRPGPRAYRHQMLIARGYGGGNDQDLGI